MIIYDDMILKWYPPDCSWQKPYGFRLQIFPETNPMNNKLVGGLVAIFYFPINLGNVIIPFDFHIFQRGGPTTNQSSMKFQESPEIPVFHHSSSQDSQQLPSKASWSRSSRNSRSSWDQILLNMLSTG